MHKSVKEDKAKMTLFVQISCKAEFSDSYLSQGRSHRVTNLQVKSMNTQGLNTLI